jgi:subtilisin family serine protease
MPLIAETRQRYTVVTNSNTPRAHALRRLTSDSAEKIARRVRTYKNISGFALDLTAEEAAALRSSEGVEAVEPVVERRASAIGRIAPNYERYNPQVTPWGVPVVHAAEVWPVTRGEGLNVAVLDTGVDWNHPDLEHAYAGGVNILDETKLPIDDNKHGTHVAGIIAATQNDFGIVGVAPGVKLWNVKVLDIEGNGFDEYTAAGIDWVVEHQRLFGGRWVINMSLGAAVEGGKLERKAVERAFNAGIILVAAAGNRNADFLDFPAAYPGVIAVGAVGEDGKKAEFSSYGFGMPIVAPGVRVQSTLIEGVEVIGEVATGPTGATLRDARGLNGSPFGTFTGKIVPSGTGAPQHFTSAVAGNIALIQRGGDLAFREKARNAKNAGASAVIIWNHENVPGTPLWTLQPKGCGPGENGCEAEWKDYEFPLTVGISNADGLALAAQGQQNGTISFLQARYGRLSGTSMAAPHVAAIAALLLSLDPTMNPTEVEYELRRTARDTADPGWDYETGWGIVDALAAAQYVAPQRFNVPQPSYPSRRRSTRP